MHDNRALAKIGAIRVGDLDVGTRVVDASGAIISWMSGQVFNVLGGAVRATLHGAVALFGLYFLLSAPPASWSRVAVYLPFSRDGADLLAQRFRQVTEATLLGTALTAERRSSRLSERAWPATSTTSCA